MPSHLGPNETAEDDLARKGEATAAFLQGLRDATHRALPGMTRSDSLAGALLVANPRQKLEEWKKAVSSLEEKDVDPLAIQYKEDLAKHLETFVSAMELVQMTLELTPEAFLDKVAELPPNKTPHPAALEDLAAFFTITTPKVKAELEKRYNRKMPMPGME